MTNESVELVGCPACGVGQVPGFQPGTVECGNCHSIVSCEDPSVNDPKQVIRPSDALVRARTTPIRDGHDCDAEGHVWQTPFDYLGRFTTCAVCGIQVSVHALRFMLGTRGGRPS